MTQSIVITGVSGFIARHIALAFLRDGAVVRGTVRSLDKAEAVRKGLAAHDPAAGDPARLSFVAADLTADAGWREAMASATAVMHVASPFPMAQPRDRNALTPAARDGALRVINAALDAGVPRIVMTASMVTMMYRPNRPAVFPVTENDWTDINWKALSAYVVSKTEAERAAWNLVVERGAKERFTTIHPGLVAGPALDRDFGASIELIRMMMTGAYPAMPPSAYPLVDVRDVADLHVAAAKRPQTGGRRLMAVGGVMSMAEMGASLKKSAPDLAAKAPTTTLPGFLVRLIAHVDRNLAAVLPDLGARPRPEADYVAELTGIAARPAKDALGATARSLAKAGVL